jgi:hypothetical protein
MKKFFKINIFFLYFLLLFSIFYFLNSNVSADTSTLTITVVPITPPPTCGNGTCGGGETCSSCPADCGACPSGGGGGGGGGGIIITASTQVTFKGMAYPLSPVTILKDGQKAVTTIAGPDAKFEVSLSGLSSGNYNFSVFGEDKQKRTSPPFTFSVYITYGATTVISGIFIAPTIDVDKSEVKRGDNIAILGQSVPNGEITIAVSSEEDFFAKIKSDAIGAYLYNFDTSDVEMGQHYTKSKAAVDGEISSFGKAISFLVGTKNVAAQPVAKCPSKADLNNDCRINLVDFSIAAYWYKRPLSEAFKLTEKERLNGDSKINLVDFSIMAYYWTG